MVLGLFSVSRLSQETPNTHLILPQTARKPNWPNQRMHQPSTTIGWSRLRWIMFLLYFPCCCGFRIGCIMKVFLQFVSLPWTMVFVWGTMAWSEDNQEHYCSPGLATSLSWWQGQCGVAGDGRPACSQLGLQAPPGLAAAELRVMVMFRLSNICNTSLG